MSELAEEIPADWQASVLRLNGTTGKKQPQKRSNDPSENLEDSLNRIEHALDLLIHVVEDGYFTPSRAEEQHL